MEFILLPAAAALLAIMSTPTATSLSPSPNAPPRLRRYLLARHGETNFNKEMREQGALDAPVLTLDGIAQASGLGMYVRRRQSGEFAEDAPRISRIWCSPLTRCRQTLAAVVGVCSRPPSDGGGASSSSRIALLPEPTVRDELREIELREWQGRLTQEIRENDPTNWETFANEPHRLRLDGGTFAPVLDLWDRGGRGWEAIRSDAAAVANASDGGGDDDEAGAVFVMCHGGTGQCLLLRALGIGPERFRRNKAFAFENAGCVEVEWADGEERCRRWRRVHPEETDWTSAEEAREVAARGEVSRAEGCEASAS